MRELTTQESVQVNGGLINRIDFCVGGTTLLFAGAGAVFGGSAGFGVGAGAGAQIGGMVGASVGQMFCSSFFSN
ncbi:hypothetical protein HBF26_16780 [Luteibacter jiangsuensis]|uniref:Bacteriocin class II with double-glycine leader peptide n=1 Tax=Luteibacter jiangsuensis TaxID=637577 RepID=A0ABX0QAL5_9GAMM|nr:Blp family class II bacteriocin [Luteibacter jiangsuensis]NID06552.1 hypothetical protein [Luteibacter jiangsuensis]